MSRRRARGAALLAVLLVAGCVADRGAPPPPPQVAPGAARATVEDELGAPLAEWDTPRGVHYCRYVARLTGATGYAKLVVSYDDAGHVIGVFEGAGLFERLPEDGRR